MIENAGEEENVSHWVIVHEKISNFKNAQGEISEMEPMPMSFVIFKKVSSEPFAAGDKVAMTFEVRWDQAPHLFITQIEKIDPSTALDLGGFYLEK